MQTITDISTRMEDIAVSIYSALYGHLDDTRFEDTKTTEIADWLKEADDVDEVIALVDAGHLDRLIAEWAEYDEQAGDEHA